MKFLKSLFKPANSNSRFWNLIKTFFQTVVFWSLFLIAFPYMILQLELAFDFPKFEGMLVLGSVFFILFSLLGLYSGYIMSWYGKGTPLPTDCPRELVISGPYKLVRNPLAVAGIGQGICIGLIFGSFGVILYALSGAVLWHFFVRPAEEKDLMDRFGENYAQYKSRVRCWIPSL